MAAIRAWLLGKVQRDGFIIALGAQSVFPVGSPVERACTEGRLCGAEAQNTRTHTHAHARLCCLPSQGLSREATATLFVLLFSLTSHHTLLPQSSSCALAHASLLVGAEGVMSSSVVKALMGFLTLGLRSPAAIPVFSS